MKTSLAHWPVKQWYTFADYYLSLEFIYIEKCPCMVASITSMHHHRLYLSLPMSIALQIYIHVSNHRSRWKLSFANL